MNLFLDSIPDDSWKEVILLSSHLEG
uniref:Uncharacterized protein n=1 Tax=Rhizophora mucronata TaxID=61149 RepID=A0A2P2JSU3_RHIMU